MKNNRALKKNSVIVHLMGGLGNQLFQIAAGLEKCESFSKLIVDSTYGSPRLTEKGKPEISSFSLDYYEVIKEVKRCKFTLLLGQKVYGLAIRAIKKRSRVERYLAQLIVSFLNYSRFGRLMPTFIPIDLGWDEKFKSFRNGYIVGYCQSYMYSSNSHSKLRKLRLENASNIFRALHEEIILDSPLILHLRRGDYRDENEFGLLDLDFYKRSYEKFSSEHSIRPCWLFSDSQDEFEIQYFKKELNISKFVDSNIVPTSEAFELMRHGSGYIIGNSSFSWWAAMLAYDLDAPVFAPSPWFKLGESPSQLLPPHWITVESSFE